MTALVSIVALLAHSRATWGQKMRLTQSQMPRIAARRKGPCDYLVLAQTGLRGMDRPVVIFFSGLISAVWVSVGVREANGHGELTHLRPFSNRPLAIVDAREVVSLETRSKCDRNHGPE